MRGWRIIEDRLPAPVRETIFDVVARDAERRGAPPPEWDQLHMRPSRGVFRYTPPDGGPSWAVKWAKRYPLRRRVKMLLGPSEFEHEARMTALATTAGLPTAPFQLVAITHPWRIAFHALLVSPYLEGTKSLSDYMYLEEPTPRVLDQLLRGMAGLAARVHKAGFLHGDISVGNIRVGEDGAMWLLDWQKAQRPQHADPAHYRSDLARLARQLYKAHGLEHDALRALLQAYVDAARIPPSRADEWLEGVIRMGLTPPPVRTMPPWRKGGES